MVGIDSTRVNRVLDADTAGFFKVSRHRRTRADLRSALREYDQEASEEGYDVYVARSYSDFI